MKSLLRQISACTICEEFLPLGPRPVVSASSKSRTIIIGQAPGTKVHASGIPWDDASGKRLREWLDVSSDDFYDTDRFAIVPMGFCYPGKGKSGDLAPRKECASTWHDKIIKELNKLELYILIGQYAQAYYLGHRAERSLTETVRNTKKYLPSIICLPHPSPRNNIWLKRNPWFEEEILPLLRQRVFELSP